MADWGNTGPRSHASEYGARAATLPGSADVLVNAVDTDARVR